MTQEGAITLEDVTLKTFAPQAARTNLEGEEMEAPKMRLTFVVDLDRISGYMTRIAKAYRKNRAITLSIEFGAEQLELAARADENGHGDEADKAVGQKTIPFEAKHRKKKREEETTKA
jgi:hypothetical protein